MSAREHDRSDDPRYERFVQSFAEVHDNLFAYIFSILPHWSDAEDVFQQTSLVLWRKFADFTPGTDFLSWACRIAFFEVRNFRRTAGRDRLQFNEALLDQLAAERDVRPQRENQRRDYLLECIEKLSDAQRELLEQAYQRERTLRQLAEELHRAPQTVYNRLNIVRRILFDCIQSALERRRSRP